MNTIANTVASKLFVAFVATAMLFTLATPAKAATMEELQAQIAALMAQISALSSSPATGAGAAGCTFTRALTVGSEGSDVNCLQNYLTSTGHYSFSGGSTGYFGPVTVSAVAAWQGANGVTPAVGYFGPVSQAKYNMLMAAAPVTPTTPGTDDSDDSDSDSDVSLSGEASLDTFEIADASDDEIEEGAEDAVVAELTVEFSDGDAEISRMDITFAGVSDVWDVLDEVSLWVDGDEVARMDASSESDYQDEDDGTLRFSGLDIVGMEDEEFEISVAVSLASSIDSDDRGAYTVKVDNMRFFDADGVATTEEASDFEFGDTASFTIVEAGADDELVVKTSTSDPDGTTLAVEDDSKSSWFTIFAFDLDTDDSVNDIELNEVVVRALVSSSTFAAIVDDAELVIDGVTIDDYTASSTADGVLTFDVDGDVTIEAGDRVTAELKLRFKSLALGNEGITVTGSVSSAMAEDIDAEGADTLDVDQLSGAATGDAHTLRTKGINVSAEDTSAVVTVGDQVDDDYATFKIEVEITAFEQDVYISTSPATSITYAIEDGASTATSSGSRTVTLTSTADEVGSTFEITEGSTETLTLSVTYDPSVTTSTAARLQLETIIFGQSSGSPTGQTWTASPDTDYRTAVVTIVD